MNEIAKDPDLNLRLYQKMYLIRKAEEYIQKEYPNDQMKTPMHMSMGEEAIVVGVCEALKDRGLFFGTYRTHALYLAVTSETDKFFAELYGKSTGTAGGRAGSMHLASSKDGLILTSAVVGTTIPVAVGAALASKMKNDGKIAVSFFGDGAIDEGVFWESLNAACLWKLPVIFVCEDNGLAIQIPSSRRRGYKSLRNIVAGFNCFALEANTTDVKLVYELARNAVEHIRTGGGPVFLNLRYCRCLDHVGIDQDFKDGYRPEEEFKEWEKRDPLKTQREFLTQELGLEGDIKALEGETDNQIFLSVAMAKRAPFPSGESLDKGVSHD